MSNKLFRFIDLFAGVGGFHIAASDLGGKCVFASEIHQGLQDLYEANFGIKPFGDIRDIEIEKIPKHDVLFAGFPCQPFSKAGAQRGRRDVHRGRLIDNVFEIISTHRPTLIVLENVPNILKQREGKYQNDIAGDFESLGYQVKSIELSPHQLGVPQIRKRIYLSHRFVRSILIRFIVGLAKFKRMCEIYWKRILRMQSRSRQLIQRQYTCGINC